MKDEAATVSDDPSPSEESSSAHKTPVAEPIHRLSDNVTSLTSSQNGFVHSPAKDTGKSTETDTKTNRNHSEDETTMDETCRLLLEGKNLAEEKVVGPEIPFSEDLSKLSTLAEDDLDKQLDKELESALEGECVCVYVCEYA